MTTRMNNPALLLSLLALAALGLVACGGGNDDQTTVASADTRTPVAPTPVKYATKVVPKGTGNKAIRSGSATRYTPSGTGARKAETDTTTEAKLSREQKQELWAKLSRKQKQELKAKLSREQVQELRRDANTEAKLSPEQVQALRLEANEWARHFSRGGVCDKYMGQPICVALTPVSEAFQKSFADATVEDIKSERIELAGWTDRPLYVAAVKFSNGEVVVFSGGDESFTCAGGGDACIWSFGDLDQNRRFIQAATVAP
jgi:hypothetical protein